MGWMNFSAAALITEDKLVFSHVNSETPWNPFTVSSYDLWGESWSFPKEEQMPGKAKQGCQPQSLVAVKDEVFTVQAEGKEGRAVLYGASRLDSDRPLYSTYGPVTTVNVIQDKTVFSYNTESHRWDHLALAGNVVGSSWLALSDSRIVSHGDGYVSRVRNLCIIVTGPIPTFC